MIYQQLGRSVDSLESYAGYCWILAVIGFGIGDAATTSIGLSFGTVAEVGPFVAPIIQRHGVQAMIVLKILVFAIAWVLWRITPRPHAIGVPLGLAVLGVLVTGWNTFILFLAAGL